MTERYYLHGGAYHQAPEDDDWALPEGAVEVPRLPGPGESWDGTTFAVDEEARIRLEQDEAAVTAAHLVKRVEAAVIASGVELTAGLLWAEAQATGQALSELADAVLLRAEGEVAQEVARRTAIAAARS